MKNYYLCNVLAIALAPMKLTALNPIHARHSVKMNLERNYKYKS